MVSYNKENINNAINKAYTTLKQLIEKYPNNILEIKTRREKMYNNGKNVL